jgi:hypothetical protein
LRVQARDLHRTIAEGCLEELAYVASAIRTSRLSQTAGRVKVIVEPLDLTVNRWCHHSLRWSVAPSIEDDPEVPECSPDRVELPDSGQKTTTPHEVA